MIVSLLYMLTSVCCKVGASVQDPRGPDITSDVSSLTAWGPMGTVGDLTLVYLLISLKNEHLFCI